MCRGRRPEHVRAILNSISVPDDQAIVTSVVTKEGIHDLRDSIVGLVESAREDT